MVGWQKASTGVSVHFYLRILAFTLETEVHVCMIDRTQITYFILLVVSALPSFVH